MAEEEPTMPGAGRAVPPCEAFKELLNYCNAMTEASVARSDGRFMVRLMRYIKTLRNLLKNHSFATLPVLKDAIVPYTNSAPGCKVSDMALKMIGDTEEPMKDAPEDEAKVNINLRPILGMQEFVNTNSHLVETKVLLITLLLIYLIDTGRGKEAMELGEELANYVFELKTVHMDQLAGKVYFYYSRAFELGGRLQETRSLLMNAYRKAYIHHQPMTEAVTFNCIIRNLVNHKLYSSASTLILKSRFPDSLSSNAQYARYLFYCGKILAVQLEYSEAHNKLVQALRKAPQSVKTGYGFKLAVTKISVIVTLLMGDVPEKSTFTNPLMKRDLAAYEEVTIAVMHGDLSRFSEVCDKHRQQFEKDGTFFLIARLRHNVIKGGLRKINLAYSRIAIKDVAEKLGIKSVEDTESIVAKAIKDGIIEATIYHDQGYIESKVGGIKLIDTVQTNVNTFVSDQPLKAFQKRIDFCLKLHESTTQALRYPDECNVFENQAPPPIVIDESATLEDYEGVDDGDML